jgi:hypothetical protein
MTKSKWIRGFFLATMMTAATLVMASLFYRLTKGKPIFMSKFSEVYFNENWRSGHSDRRFSSGLTQAPGILWIVVVQNRLQVSPHFPFTLAFAAEALGWDHLVPGNSILDVRVVSSGTAAASVKIRYRHLTGDEETLHLVVQDREAFLAALAKIRAS